MTRNRAALRCRTLFGGVGLGGVLVVALAVAGVVGVPLLPWQHTPRPERPLTATQPELRRTLLTGNDLRTGYAPATPTASTGTPGHGPRAAESARCRDLVERPWEIAAPAARTRPEIARYGDSARGVVLHQALLAFTADGASEALARLRSAAAACPRPHATLDGTDVTVALDEIVGEPGAPEGGDEAYTMGFVARGGGRAWTGCLAVDRVGRVLSVLWQVGPRGALAPGELAAIRRAAVDKARLLPTGF